MRNLTSKKLDSNSANATLPESILAFRSITTLLAALQGLRGGEITTTPSDNSLLSREVRQELKILAALATVLVRKWEVVAIVSLNDERAQQGNPIKAIACTHSDSADDKKQPEPSQMVSVKPPSWSLFTTGNYRRNDHKTNGSLGVGTQRAPISLAKDLDVGSGVDLRELYIKRDAYVQFKSFKLEHFSCHD